MSEDARAERSHPRRRMEVLTVNEFLTLAALLAFTAAGTGLLIAGVIHVALATDVPTRRPVARGPRSTYPTGRAAGEKGED